MNRARQPSARKLWAQISLSILGWCLTYPIFDQTSTRLGLDYSINIEILWRLLGEPDSIYTFRNLLLPRMIAFVIAGVPACMLALLVFVTFDSTRRRIGCIVIGVVLVTALLFSAVADWESSRAFVEQRFPRLGLTIAYAAYLLATTALLAWALGRAISNPGAPAQRPEQTNR